MSEFLNALVNGVALGLVYSLVAVGIVLLYKSTGVLNFAHGTLMTTGAFIAASLATGGRGFWLAAALTVLIMTAFGGVLYNVTLRPLATAGLFSGVMVTIGLSSAILGVLSIMFGTGPRLLPSPITPHQLSFTDKVGVPATLALCGAVALGAVIIFGLVFRYTTLGVRLRAAAENSVLASSLGVDLGRNFTIAWALSSGLAATAGLLLGSLSVIDLSLGDFALRAFSAVIVGGVESIWGTVAGGVLVGVTEIVSATYLGSDWRLPSTMALLLVFLLVRPTGLLGQRTLQRV